MRSGWPAFGLALLLFLADAARVSSAETIAVPWIGQKGATECGRAVLASLAARRGGAAESHYRKLPAPPDRLRGYSVAEMQRFGARVGVSLTLRAPAGLVIAGECSARPAVAAHYDRLTQIVAGGTPVVVPVKSGVVSGHYLILVGTSGDGYSVHDPATPGVSRISRATLMSRMCDYGYLALVAR